LLATQADVMPRDWRQKLLIFLMLVYGLTLTATADLLQSTYLLGAFMGGFSFVKVQGAAELWEHQVGPFEGALSG
jgi:Kef-type K+ transport system membrane component KefB